MYPGKNLRLKCAQAGCCLQFSSYSGFRIVPYETPSTYENEKDNSHSLNDEIPSTSSQCQNVESGPSVSTHKKDMCASIIAKLLGSGVPNTVVLSTIENLEEFVEDLQSNIKDHVLNLVTDNNPSRPAIEELFKRLENPFSQLNTDTKWKKYFRDKWGVVEPVELRFGVRYETKRNNKTGTYEQVPVNDKFIYIFKGIRKLKWSKKRRLATTNTLSPLLFSSITLIVLGYRDLLGYSHLQITT